MSSQENASKEKSALLCLPDDALITIMGYLDWRTQLILTQTHIRFLAIVHNIWRSKYKTLIIGEEDGCGMREKDFKYFIGILQSTLNVFCMHIDNRKHFEILLNFVFPNLHDFTFHTNSFDLDFSDEDMPKMIKAFPNLRSFSPQGSFTGKFFEGFTLLENLTLTKCKSFRARYLFRILEIRKLKTLKLGVFESIESPYTNLPMEGTVDLEVLECNGHEMTEWFLNKLMLLMNLQQLTLYSIQYGGLFQRVLMLVNRSSVKSLEIINHEFFSKRLYPVINRRTQFGTLKIVRDVIRLSVRADIIPSLERVKQIHFISCVFCEEEDFRLLMTLKSTETLALYICRFNFNEYTFVANDIVNGRIKRLNLHLDANMISYKTYPDAQYDFLRLPDDVLILILGQLDLLTQLKMTHVHIRFLMLMPRVWRSQCRTTTLSLREMRLNDKDLRFFLGSNQETFQVLRLRMERRTNFDILTGYIFPNIHDFRFSTHSFWLHDIDIPRISRAFPNLRTFSPHGRFTGQHMQDFPCLENLTVSYCRDFKVGNLIPILEARMLKGLKLDMFDDKHMKEAKLPLEGIRHLEVLQCDTGEMAGWFMEHLEQLTKLKKLIFCGVANWDVVRRVLNSSHRKSIRSVQLNISGDLYLFPGLKVKIHTLQIASAVILHQMPSGTVNLNINRINLKQCGIPIKEYFDKWLKDFKTLEVLGLDSCQFKFRDYTFPVPAIVRNRNTTLHVHLHQNVYLDSMVVNPILPMQWNVEGEHSFFKLHEGTLNITYHSEPVAIYFE